MGILICWRVGSWREADFAVKAAILVWIVYAVIDVLVLVAVGMSEAAPARLIVLKAISIITKSAASYFSGIVGSRRVLNGYASALKSPAQQLIPAERAPVRCENLFLSHC
jgi:sugar phosphate permease